MSLRLETVTKPFIDPAGAPVDGASFTLRKRMSFECQQKYSTLLTRIVEDPDALQKMKDAERTKFLQKLARQNPDEFTSMTKLLMDDCLMALQGVELDNGSPWPLHTFHTFDSHYVNQVTAEIQKLSEEQAAQADPNSQKPSRR